MPNLMPDFTEFGQLTILLVIVGLCIIEATLLIGSLVPGELLIIAGVITLGPEYFPAVAVAAILGSFIGQMGGYTLGRLTGTKLRYSWAGRKLGEHRWARTEALVHQAGPTMMSAIRFVAVGHTLAPILAGAMGISARRFCYLAMVSSAAWAVVWSLLGFITSGFGHAVNSQLIALILGVLGMIVAGIAITRAANRALVNKSVS